MDKLKDGQELFLNKTYNLENGLQFQFEKRKNFIKNHNSYILVIFKNENYTNSTRFLLSGVQIQEETRTSYYGTQHSTSIQIKSIESINKDPIKTRTGTRKN